MQAITNTSKDLLFRTMTRTMLNGRDFTGLDEGCPFQLNFDKIHNVLNISPNALIKSLRAATVPGLTKVTRLQPV